MEFGSQLSDNNMVTSTVLVACAGNLRCEEPGHILTGAQRAFLLLTLGLDMGSWYNPNHNLIKAVLGGN